TNIVPKDALPNFWLSCAHCESRGYVVENLDSKKILKQFSKIIEKRPAPREEYDQTAISAEDAICRVGYFHERGDLLNKEILMIGDFDCLSIVCALSGYPKRVAVLEVDDGLVNFINTVAKEHNLPLF